MGRYDIAINPDKPVKKKQVDAVRTGLNLKGSYEKTTVISVTKKK